MLWRVAVRSRVRRMGGFGVESVSWVMVYLCRSVHRYTDTQRETEFSCARVDNLVRRVESPGEMTELFEGRDDFLYIRHVTFDRRVEFSEPDMDAGPDERPLQVKICKPETKKDHILLSNVHWCLTFAQDRWESLKVAAILNVLSSLGQHFLTSCPQLSAPVGFYWGLKSVKNNTFKRIQLFPATDAHCSSNQQINCRVMLHSIESLKSIFPI